MSSVSKERPSGLKYVVVLEYLSGIALILTIFLIGSEPYEGLDLTVIFLILAFFVGIICATLGRNILKKDVGIRLYPVAMIAGILGVIIGVFFIMSYGIIPLLAQGIVLYYLTRPEIKEYFGIEGFLR